MLNKICNHIHMHINIYIYYTYIACMTIMQQITDNTQSNRVSPWYVTVLMVKVCFVSYN